MSTPIYILGGGGLGREIAASVEGAIVLDDQLGVRPFETLPANAPTIIAIGDPLDRRDVWSRMALQDPRYCDVVHPSAVRMSKFSNAGRFFAANSTVTVDVRLGSHVYVLNNAVVGHDCEIEDFVTICPSATISGGCHIGKCAFIGAGATVLPGVAIGSFALVGAGAVVARNVAPMATVVGIPARQRGE